jgi:hypothetical protein
LAQGYNVVFQYRVPIGLTLDLIHEDQMYKFQQLGKDLSALSNPLPFDLRRELLSGQHERPGSRYILLEGCSPRDIADELLNDNPLGRLKTVSLDFIFPTWSKPDGAPGPASGRRSQRRAR